MTSDRRCPCCNQWMPHTDFKLWPKSGAVMRDGYVIILGPVSYRIVECLYKIYPDYVPTERIMNYLYAGTRHADMSPKTLHANVHHLQRKIQTLNCRITSLQHYGYALHIDSNLRDNGEGPTCKG